MAVLLHYYHRLVSYVLKASSHGLVKIQQLKYLVKTL